jgi:hypothetical protein
VTLHTLSWNIPTAKTNNTLLRMETRKSTDAVIVGEREESHTLERCAKNEAVWEKEEKDDEVCISDLITKAKWKNYHFNKKSFIFNSNSRPPTPREGLPFIPMPYVLIPELLLTPVHQHRPKLGRSSHLDPSLSFSSRPNPPSHYSPSRSSFFCPQRHFPPFHQSSYMPR